MSRPAVMLYSFSRYGLGHLVRCSALANGFAKRAPVVLVADQPRFEWLSDRVTFVRVAPEEGTQRREDLAAALVTHRPHTIIIDHFPFSWRVGIVEPIVEALVDYRRRVGPLTVVGGFRGVLGNGHERAGDKDGVTLSGRIDAIERLLRDVVDYCFVYAPEGMRGELERHLPLLAVHRARLFFVGFVSCVPAQPIPLRQSPFELVVQLGSGGDGADQAVALSAALADARLPDRVLFVLGPARATHVDRSVRATLGDRVTCVDYWPRLGQATSSASAVVSMSGYNTCMSLLQSRAPAIALPRIFRGNEEQSEQLIWARLLTAYFGLFEQVILPPYSPAYLRESIQRLLTAPRRTALASAAQFIAYDAVLDRMEARGVRGVSSVCCPRRRLAGQDDA